MWFKSRKRRTYSLLVLALVVIGIGLALVLKMRIDDILRSQINSALSDDISFDYERSKLNVFRGKYRLEGIEVAQKEDDSLNWRIRLESLELNNFNAFRFLKTSELHLDSLFLQSPEIEVYRLTKQSDKQKQAVKETQSQSIGIGLVLIEDGTILYDPLGPEIFRGHFSAEINLFDIQKVKEFTIAELDAVNFEIHGGLYQLKDSVHEISFDKAALVGHKNHLSIENFNYKPRLSPYEYSKHYGWRKDHLQIDVDSISLNFSPDSSLKNIHLPLIEIVRPKVLINKDGRFPLPDRSTSLPQEMLGRLGLFLQIDSISVAEGSLQFNLKLDNQEHAVLNIGKINGNLSGIQNTTDSLPAFSLSATAIMNDKAPLQISSTYHYGHNDPFVLNGSIGNTKLHFMDSFLKNMAGITIADGQLDKMSFSIIGNTDWSSGSVDFYYDNLSIHLINTETSEEKKFINVLSDVLGSLVFWKENPSKSGFRRGAFSSARDKRKGFIAQWVDGILEGVLNTVSKIDPNKIQGSKTTKKSRKK